MTYEEAAAYKAAAYINAQAVAANIELQAMIAENQEREANGMALAHGAADFMRLQEDYCITHNSVMSFYQG